MSESEEHFPWHYTEFGVVCACGASMRNEVCPEVEPSREEVTNV